MIRHILKDGREVDSIAGTVIRQQDFKDLYRVIDQMEKRLRYEGETNEYKEHDTGGSHLPA